MKACRKKRALFAMALMALFLLLFYGLVCIGHDGCCRGECPVCLTMDQLRLLGHTLALTDCAALLLQAALCACMVKGRLFPHGVMTLTEMKVKLSD